MAAGGLVLLWSGFSFWEQSQAARHHPEVVRETYDGWDNKTRQQTMAGPEEKFTSDGPDYEKGEQVARLSVPVIGNEYDVFWGTDSETLKQGVGMYDSKWTVSPAQSGHVVLSGHRDTVFTGLQEMEENDRIYVTYNDEVYEYQVRNMWITDSEDRSVIVEKEKPTLTLTTCYPFDYIGSAPDRFIVQSELVSKKPVHK